MRFLVTLDQDVAIVVRPRANQERAAALQVL
jgi:hypothetical protein